MLFFMTSWGMKFANIALKIHNPVTRAIHFNLHIRIYIVTCKKSILIIF